MSDEGRDPREEITFAGPKWRHQGRFAPVRQLVPLVVSPDPLEAALAVRTFLKACENESKTLAADEQLVVLLGYEASVALDPGAARHLRRDDFGPDGLAWIVRRAPSHEGEQCDAPTLKLSVRSGEGDAHRQRVAACQDELRAGTLYQANLAHPLRVAPQGRDQTRAFFAANTDGESTPNFAVMWEHAAGMLVSLSPECLVEFDLARAGADRPRMIRAFPIKGTRPRGASPEEDEREREALTNSEKDRAEHVMIVDLLRHDLGRVAAPASVTVEHLARLLPLSNVHHLESVIAARLRDEVDLADILSATAPGGSITGAPKSTAIEMIHAFESGPRGPYTGTIGVIDADGRGVFNLLIRTWIRPNDGPGTLHVGGGIVVDSDPQKEFEETLDKARAFGRVNREIG